jgi:hypothetical protein
VTSRADEDNNLAVFNNTGSVGVYRNAADDNVLIFGNSGRGNRVRYKTAGINVDCHDNTSHKFKSVGNTAGGQLMGQCA